MWKVIGVIMLAVVFAGAQPFQNLLLPQARHAVGVVVDQDGNPVAGARIEHSGELRHEHLTDMAGRFELETRAPALVIRKAGFRSAFLRARDSAESKITLQKSGEKPFPVCSSNRGYVGIEGWSARFQFLRIPEVKISPQGRDIDYGARGYYVATKSGRKGITHGSGPMWDFGSPSDGDVWPSVTYDETAYEMGKLTVTDAKGQLSNGNRWRYIGTFGESAEYSDVDEATASILDKFLDGACSKP